MTTFIIGMVIGFLVSCIWPHLLHFECGRCCGEGFLECNDGRYVECDGCTGHGKLNRWFR